MADEKILNTVPVTDGTVNISIAEYRGLIETVAASGAEAAIQHTEKMKYFSEKMRSEDVAKAANAHVETLQARIAELEAAGKQMCDFLDSQPHLRGEFNLFLHERDLGRKAAEVEV